jgi:hypothetical protein
MISVVPRGDREDIFLRQICESWTLALALLFVADDVQQLRMDVLWLPKSWFTDKKSTEMVSVKDA